ncbi:uncharacterized protein LOC114845312 isoform X4 [Betta splendens]|uniref:Uncharacterized protein LOC114845312 isoform X4 n=1 Tax=Betta splendens TaxID=158456 RepID=A0A9W2XFR5_BETSP|nr:uncharacterized protein LOC114845312 isoform X4 [Betta splendens]
MTPVLWPRNQNLFTKPESSLLHRVRQTMGPSNRMLLGACVMLLVALWLSLYLVRPSLDEQWEQWKTKYKKLYKNQVSVEMPVMKASNRMLRHILAKISRKMTVLDQELKIQIWEKMNKKLIKYDKILNQQILNKMTAGIKNDWMPAHVLKEVETTLAECNAILRALVLNDIYEQMDNKSITSRDFILQDIAKTVAQYQRIKVYKSSGKNLPKSIDYRQHSLVTPVRNQVQYSETTSSSHMSLVKLKSLLVLHARSVWLLLGL